MDESLYFEDVSPEEEANLPLPADWMRTIQTREDGMKVRVYKNIKSGQELDEHPIIARAMNVARKVPLPLGWCVMETRSEQGNVERFYYNADLQLSLWDPPMLRSCLADYLKVLGFDPASIGFRLNGRPLGFEERKSPLLSSNIVDQVQAKGSTSLLNGNEIKMSLMDLDQHRGNDLPAPTSVLDVPGKVEAAPAILPVQRDPPQSIAIPNPQSYVPPPRDWEGLLNIYKEPILPFAEKISHRADNLQPPMTWAGVKILRGDVKDANERTHHLISRIRSMLASKRGYVCSFLYHDSEESEADEESDRSGNVKSVVTLASDIVTTLRQQPELVVMAIASNNTTIGSTAMLQAAFVALHRLLHPFSTDYSMTTALLLQSINYQLEELGAVEQIFCHMDSKMIIPRALSIYDPILAVQWNPVDSPLPMIPNVQSETTFACLMRVYSIRRDVTAFFRAIWKPVLPAIATLLESTENASNPVVLENLVALAYRLLEHTFHEKSMTVFPITATAVCRAVYEIGGYTAMITVIYNFLILPNLVKILGGDHDSLENEDVYRVEHASKVINRYFDCSWWLQDDTKITGKLYKSDSDRPLVILKSFLWTVWRLFSCSMYLSETVISAFTVPEFIMGRLSFLNCAAIKDHKLRNLLSRVNRKVSHGCSWLVQMPLDVHGNNFLGVEQQDLDFDGVLTLNHETHELLDRRLSSLSFKPGQMLNATVVSKYELCGFLSDIGCAMDEKDFPTNSPIYRAIADFLCVYGGNPTQNGINQEENTEEFITLTFLYSADDYENHEDAPFIDSSMIQPDNSPNAEAMVQEYRQLLSGLKLLNRYEDTLLNLIRKVENDVVSNIYELLSDATDSWYLEPEFDTEFKVNHIDIAEKHTNESKNKLKHSYHGVKQSRPVQLFPLFAQHTSHDHHPNNKSMKELQNDFFRSFRFGSAQDNVAVGTSMARPKVLPPKVERGQIKVTTLPTHQNSHYAPSEASSRGSNQRSQNLRSHFTEPTIRPNSSILAPTKAFLNMKNAPTVTPVDLDKNFMKSMRDHQVISTEDFKMRYFRRRNQAAKFSRGIDVIVGGNNGKKSTRERKIDTVTASIAKPPPAPKPFPAHLRHLIRHDEGEQQDDINDLMGDDEIYGNFQDDYFDNLDSTEVDDILPVQSSGQYYGYEENGFSQHHQSGEALKFDSNYFHSLIHDYQATIQPVAHRFHEDFNSTAALLSAQQFQQQQQSNKKDGGPLRSRSPALPTPLDNSRIWSPTKSYVQKHASHDTASIAFMRDISEGRPPELRQYPKEIPAIAHDAPFSPTKTKLYKSTGPRVPQVPEFLGGELEGAEGSVCATSISTSRDSTPYSRRGRSGSRSRSSSPATRRRSGSYAKPTFASIQQLSDRSYNVRGEMRPDTNAPKQRDSNSSPRSSLSSSPRRTDSTRKVRDFPNPKSLAQPNDVDTDHDLIERNRGEPVTIEPEMAILANDFLHHYIQQPLKTQELELNDGNNDVTFVSPEKTVPTAGTYSVDGTDPTNCDSFERESPPPPPNTEIAGIKVIKKKVKLGQRPRMAPLPQQPSSHDATPPPKLRRQLVTTGSLPQHNQLAPNHKQTFAEAIASVVNEAATSNVNQPLDSTYSVNFSPDVDYSRTTVNLKEDREQALEKRRELLQRRIDDEDPEEGKYLEFRSGQTSVRGKSERVKSSSFKHDPEVDSADVSPSRVPIMKRKSLIKNFSANKELFLSGFYAKKVNFHSNYLIQ